MLITDAEPDRFAPLAPPAFSAGFGWCGALCANHRGVRHAERSVRPTAGPRLQRPVQGRRPQEHCSSQSDARAFQAGAGSGAATPTERGHDREHHGNHGLAAALGARVFCRRGAQKLGLSLASEKTDDGRVYRIAGPGPIATEATAVQPSA